MQFYYSLLTILLLLSGNLSAQDGLIGQGFSTGFNNPGDIATFSASAGGSQIYETTSNATGNQFFRLLNGTSELGPFGCVDADWSSGEGFSYDNMPNCGGGAFFINVANTTDTYVFKTPSAADNDFTYFKLAGNVPEFDLGFTGRLPMGSPVTATTTVSFFTGFDIPVPAGATAYLRYSLDGFATSTVVPMDPLAGSMNQIFDYNLAPPPNNQGKTLTYYFFLSGDGTGAAPQASGSDADYRTIRLQADVSGNYSFMYDMTLPVIYRSWVGNRITTGVQLTWATTTEQNASHFILECSNDDGRNWNERTQIAARNATTGANYRYLDQNAPTGSLQYRLRQIDFDGQFAYSSILNISGRKEVGSVSVYPQPATAGVNVSVSDNFFGGKLELYDPAGRLVKTQALVQPSEWMETAGLPSGVYLLRVVGGDYSVTVKRVVVQ